MSANEELREVDPAARGYILNGATGDDPLRDEDVERLGGWHAGRMFFRQRNEYGPPMPGVRAWWVLLVVEAVAVIVAVVILTVGVH